MAHLYVFLDESGNFDYSPKGTPYIILTAVVCSDPSAWAGGLSRSKFRLIEQGHEISHFHCTEDRQTVRDEVYKTLRQHIEHFSVYSIIVEKRKTPPDLRPVEQLYPAMISLLLKKILSDQALIEGKREVIVITDRIPVQRARKAVEKSIKISLARNIRLNIPYRIFHHESKAEYGLQIADYCAWAIQRKWRDGDERSYQLIEDAIKLELESRKNEEEQYY